MTLREIEFLQGLEELLSLHGVELRATDHYPGYPECGQDIRIEAYACPDYDNCNGEGIDIDFGDEVSVEKIHQIVENQT